jgi:acetyltransferase-like isoleucine patch superfamily enzyme
MEHAELGGGAMSDVSLRHRVSAAFTLALGAIGARLQRATHTYEAWSLTRRMQTAGFVQLRMPLVIYEPEKIVCGADVAIGEFSHVRANAGIRIGSRVMIASHVVITTRSHPLALPRYAVTEDAPITIEDDVWIGAGAIILPGVTIGAGAVVAAGAVVNTSVRPHTLVGGVPARELKSLQVPS